LECIIGGDGGCVFAIVGGIIAIVIVITFPPNDGEQFARPEFGRDEISRNVNVVLVD
jgi:hypothetical protein